MEMDPRRTSLSAAFSRITLGRLESRVEGSFDAPNPCTSSLLFSNRALSGSLLVCGLEDGHINMLDTRDGRRDLLLKTWRPHNALIADMAFSTDDTQLITAGSDGISKVIDISSGSVVTLLDCQKTIGPLRNVRLSKPGNVALVSGRGSAVAVFDLRAPQCQVASGPLIQVVGAASGGTSSTGLTATNGTGPAANVTSCAPGPSPVNATGAGSTVSRAVPCGLLCLSCAQSRNFRGPIVEDRIGGLATVDHYLLTGNASTGEVQLWDIRRLPRSAPASATSSTPTAAVQTGAACYCEHLPVSIAGRLMHPRRRASAALMSDARSSRSSAETGKRRRPPALPVAPLHLLSQAKEGERGRAVQDLDVSADGAALLVSHAGGRILVYDLARVLCGGGPSASRDLQQGCVAAIPAAIAGASHEVASATVTGESPDRPLMGEYKESAFRYDSLAGHARCLRGGRTRARFSRCGSFVVSGSGDGMAYVWGLPQQARHRWQGCVSGADLQPQWVLYGDGVADAPCEVAWGGTAPGELVSAATRIALGGNDGIVRTWRPAVHDGEGADGRCMRGSLDGSTDIAEGPRPGARKRCFEAMWGRATDGGPDRYVAMPFAGQARRHEPQGELLSRVAAMARAAAASTTALASTQRWSIRSELAEVESSDTSCRIRGPPPLLRKQLPSSLLGTAALEEADTDGQHDRHEAASIATTMSQPSACSDLNNSGMASQLCRPASSWLWPSPPSDETAQL